MSGIKFINLAHFGVLVLAICLVHAQELNSNEEEARNFLNQTSNEMYKVFDELVDKEYFFDVDTQRNQYKTNRHYINFVNKIVEDSRKFDFQNFKDEELKYAFEILVKLADENIIGVNRYSRILESLKELDYQTKYQEITEYGQKKTFLKFDPDVLRIMRESSDEKEIQHYWAGWKKVTGQWARENLILTIEGLKDAANLSQLSPLEFWSRGFNISEMEDVVTKISPYYLELHAFLRTAMQKKYGDSVIGPDGKIPDHLFRELITQAATRYSVLEEIFPYENLPPVHSAITHKFTTKKIYESADEFYRSLGFEKYPTSIWGDRIKSYYADDNDDRDDIYYNDDEDEELECQTRVIYKTPNIKLKYCENPGRWDFDEAYKHMGYLYYAKEMVGLPAYFFSAPQSLDIAIGKTAVLSASSHKYLKKIGIIDDDVEIPRKVEMNRLIRMAISYIVFFPSLFVEAKVIADLLSGEIKMKDLNSHYWELMAGYAGIKKPEGHSSYVYDFPNIFYKDFNDNLMSSDLVTDILSFQMHKKLCELSGKYPKEPLHLCDISGSKDAGDALKKMMKLGKSKPFTEVLATMFPENPKLNTDGILEYFRHLFNMIRYRNRKANLNGIVGWKTDV